MSEEAKLVLLQEKLKEVRRGKIFTMIILFPIVFTALAIYTDMLDIWLSPISFIMWGVIGGTIYFAVDNYYNRKKNQLMQQIEQMAFTKKCFSCGKEIPKGNFAFCPFCGEELGKRAKDQEVSMNENQDSEIEQLIDSISKVKFIRGKRDSNQYVFPIQRILREAGFKTRTEKPTTYPEGYVYRYGYIDLYAKKGNTVICIEIDYRTIKKASIMKISQILKAIPVFVLTYEGEPHIEESLDRIDFPHFYLIDLYNHNVYTGRDKKFHSKSRFG